MTAFGGLQEAVAEAFEFAHVEMAAHGFKDADAASALGIFHMLVNQLLDAFWVCDVFEVDAGGGLVAGNYADGSDAEKALSERDSQVQVLHFVEHDFLFLKAYDASLDEKAVVAQEVAREADGQSEIALSVLPEVVNVEGR